MFIFLVVKFSIYLNRRVFVMQSFLSVNFQFLEVKFSIYLNRRVFVMNIGTNKPELTAERAETRIHSSRQSTFFFKQKKVDIPYST